MWNVPKQTIHTIFEKGKRGKIFVICALTNEDYAYDTLCNLRHENPENLYFMEETVLYKCDE